MDRGGKISGREGGVTTQLMRGTSPRRRRATHAAVASLEFPGYTTQLMGGTSPRRRRATHAAAASLEFPGSVARGRGDGVSTC